MVHGNDTVHHEFHPRDNNFKKYLSKPARAFSYRTYEQ